MVVVLFLLEHILFVSSFILQKKKALSPANALVKVLIDWVL
jgi:hypothetical protein